jgi:hypothetical protein
MICVKSTCSVCPAYDGSQQWSAAQAELVPERFMVERRLCAQVAAELAQAAAGDGDADAAAARRAQLLQLLKRMLKRHTDALTSPASAGRDVAMAARAVGDLAPAARRFLGDEVGPAPACGAHARGRPVLQVWRTGCKYSGGSATRAG